MPRKIILLLLAQCLLAGCASHSSHRPAALLRYDGVYSAETRIDDDLYCEYLRFYPDDTVITVTSECPGNNVLQDIRKWFSPENAGATAEGVSKGSIIRTGNKISFDAISSEGKISYNGKISEKRISLSTFSHINQYRDHEVYTFVAW